MPVFTIPLLLAYPLIVHLGIQYGQAVWAVYYLALLLFLPIGIRLWRRQRPDWLAFDLALIAMLLVLVAPHHVELLLQLQPVVIFGLLFLLFSTSLVPGSTPLISRFAIIIAKDTPQPVLHYCRWATVAWSGFFLLMITLFLWLSVSTSFQTWSWFGNLISYALIGLMFVVEFRIRRRVLKPYVDYSFFQFIRNLRQVEFRQLLALRNS